MESTQALTIQNVKVGMVLGFAGSVCRVTSVHIGLDVFGQMRGGYVETNRGAIGAFELADYVERRKA
jgi:hypothetical protein